MKGYSFLIEDRVYTKGGTFSVKNAVYQLTVFDGTLPCMTSQPTKSLYDVKFPYTLKLFYVGHPCDFPLLPFYFETFFMRAI